MGIRIHKFMGYGLDDIKAENYAISDSRINVDSLVFADYDDTTAEDYVTWLEQRYPDGGTLDGHWNLDRWAIKDSSATGKKIYLSDAWAWSPEYGMDNVLVLKPLSMSDWSRFDDGLD